MILSHFRCDWSHPPSDDPVAIYYEVDAAGRVLRLVDVFADGRRMAQALADFAGREDDLPGEDSLVEGDFHLHAAHLIEGGVAVDGEDRLSLIPIEAAAFEGAWRGTS